MDNRANILDRFRAAASDLIETMNCADPDNTIASVDHLLRAAVTALDALNNADAQVTDMDSEDEMINDPEPFPCDLCAGAGFGFDEDGAVACPDCAGTGSCV